MRPSLQQHSFQPVTHLALTVLLLLAALIGQVWAATPHAQAGMTGTMTALVADVPQEWPSPAPVPNLPTEKTPESSGTLDEPDLHPPLAVAAWRSRFPDPQTVAATGGLHVPDPRPGHYQANAPPRS